MLLGLPALVIYGFIKVDKNITMVSLPKLEPETIESFPLEVWHKPHLWKNYPNLNTRLLANTSPNHELAVELSLDGTISNPDILLYWSPRSYSVKSGISDMMHFMGTFTTTSPTIYKLPEEARFRDGFLILYSLGADRVVSEAPLVNPLK